MKITKAIERIILETKEKDNQTITQLSKKLDLTYSYASKTIQILEQRKLLTTIKKGRCKYVKITEKGIKLAKNLLKTQKIIEEE